MRNLKALLYIHVPMLNLHVKTMTMTDLAHNTFLTLELNNLQVREQGRALNCEKEGREVETHISRQA